MVELENTNNTQGQDQPTETGAEEKVYTQAEVDELLQRETDRRVTSALQKQQAKNEAKVREATKLAAMTEQQRYEYELEQREQAIAAKERELALAENKAEASKILADKGISPQLVDFVVAETADVMNNNIKLLEAEFKKSVKAEVEKRLAGATPKKGLPTDKAISKEDFLKMSFSEMMELKQSNPEIYAELSK